MWFRIQVQTKWIFEGIADCLTQYRIVAGSLASDPEQKQNAFERGIERARLYAPDQIAKFGPAASAYHLRYVARRLIQVGDSSNACRYMHRALRIYPGLILDDPGRTISSLGASWVLRLMPAAFSRRIVSGAVSVVGARQGKKLDAKVGATTKPFRWGLLGAGSVARQFGLSLDLLDGQEVHAIASRSHSRAAELAESLKRSFRTAPRALDSYEALVADPEIDAIYVSTPAAAHLENVSLALNAGKPVLCEKPFATSAAEARQIADLAAERKFFCMEAMWMRFIPAIRDLKARINRGEVGRVSLLEAELGFTQPFDPTGRHFDPAQGGGALLDLGVYPLSLARYLLGRPDRGQAISDMAATGVDAQTVMNLSFPSGALASLSCSFTQRLRNRALVAGTTGSFLTDDPMYAPGQLTHTAATMAQPAAADASSSKAGWLGRMVEKSPKLVSARRRFAPTLRQLLRRERKTYAHHFPGFGYQFEIQEVYRCVASGLLESPDMPLSESVEMMEVIDAFRNGGSFDWRKKP